MQYMWRFLFFIFSFSPLIAKSIASFYGSGNYAKCVETFEKQGAKTATERELAAECFFQLRQYKKAAKTLLPLLKKKQVSTRVLSRYVDIVKLEPNLDASFLVQKLSGNTPGVKLLAMQLESIFIDRGQAKLFMKLYKKYPIYLSDQQWNILLAQLTETQFQEVLHLANRSQYDRKYIRARYYRYHGKLKEAESILTELLKKRRTIFVLKTLASLYLQQGEHEKENLILNDFKQLGGRGYRDLAEYLFQTSRVKQAIRALEEGIQKDYYLHELYIFYLLSAGDIERAAESLALFRLQKKISPYRYQNLWKQLLEVENKKAIVQGLKRVSKKHPEICDQIVKVQMEFESDSTLFKSIQKCKVYKKEKQWESLMYDLALGSRYSLIIQLAEYKKQTRLKNTEKKVILSKVEKKLLAEAYCQVKKYDLCIQNLEDLNTKFPSASIQWELANTYIKVGKLPKAEKMLVQLGTAKATQLLFQLLVATGKQREAISILKAEKEKWNNEKKYYEAISFIIQNQYNQAVHLLESYLEGQTEKGSQAVYLLFILSYFPEKNNYQKRQDLLLSVFSWPIYSTYITSSLGKYNCNRVNSELDAYLCHWKARYGLLSPDKNENQKARKILTMLFKNPQATLLRDENAYLLNTKNFTIRFPASPFKVLAQP